MPIDRARKRRVRQAAGLAHLEELDESCLELQAPPGELLAVHDALDRLTALDATAAELVRQRYFVGLEMAEAAETLGLPLRTAERR